MEFECRTCLKVSDNLLDLFTTDLPIRIQVISSVEILEKEKFPSKICEECATNVRCLEDFRETIIKSNKMLEERCSKEGSFETYDEIIIKSEDEGVETKSVTVSEGIQENIVFYGNEEGRVYKCRRCDFTTTLHKLLRRHRSVHGVFKVACDVCGILVRKDNLNQHKLIHANSPVSCKICNKVCKTKEVLRHHINTHKTPSSEFQCTECGKIFAKRTTYYRHKNRHKLEDPRTEECSMCPKRFYDKYTLASHIRSHTGERPYPCQYCKKGFSSGYALKTHIRQHTNEKPYACNFCSTAFPQKVSLMTHVKAKHSGLVLPVLQKESNKK